MTHHTHKWSGKENYTQITILKAKYVFAVGLYIHILLSINRHISHRLHKVLCNIWYSILFINWQKEMLLERGEEKAEGIEIISVLLVRGKSSPDLSHLSK